ncbi:MAG: hypothetical protein R3F61_39175 [Myxococcota bacterium]|nr:hypothetical protein [Myxococcales bacterium]
MKHTTSPLLALLASLSITACGGSDATPPGGDAGASTGVAVEFRVTGAGADPDGFVLVTDGTDWQRHTDATVTVSLAAGSHSLRLTDLRSHCTVNGTTEREINVVDGSLTPLVWDIVCTAPSPCELRALYPNSIASTGSARALLIAIDFSDAIAVATVQDVFDVVEPWMSDAVTTLSNGTLDIALQRPIDRWLRMPNPTSTYPNSNRTQMLSDALQVAAAEVDLDLYDAIFVATPTEARSKVAWGFASRIADGAETRFIVNLGPDIWYDQAPPHYGAEIATHEFLHLLGLPDLYDVPGYSAGDYTNRYVGRWDIMSGSEGSEPVSQLLGYQRQLLGWMPPEDVDCVDSRAHSVEQVIRPIAGDRGPRSVRVRIGPTKWLVAEAVDADSVRSGCKEGVLVYTADTEGDVGSGAPELYVVRAEASERSIVASCGELYNAPFNLETPTFTHLASGVSVNVVAEREGGYLVRIDFADAQAGRCPTEVACDALSSCDLATDTCVTTGFERIQLRADVQGTPMCLYANAPSGDGSHSGAAYMADCTPSAQTVWGREDVGNGWFHLLAASTGDCLEGNESVGATSEGASFVTACSDASGQSWEFVPEGNFFRLRTEWQGSTKCLDANVPTNLALHAGGAYMADCQDVPGQRWEVLTP